MEESKRIKLEEFKLPLRDKKHEIVGWTLLDEVDYNTYKEKKFCSHDGYAFCTSGLLHRLIMKPPKGMIVDHINNNPLDNRRSNLRLVTPQENSRNMSKQKNTTSKYYGVFFNNRINKWVGYAKVAGKNKMSYFNNEDHAAYYRDSLVKEYGLTGAKLNNIEKPINFIEPIRILKSKYGLGIKQTKQNKYISRFGWNNKRIYIGTYNTQEEAQIAYNNKKEELKNQEEQIRLNMPIKRNQDGIAIIELFNKKQEKTGDALVDDYDYYSISKSKWSLDYDGYAISTILGKTVKLHRIIMNAPQNVFVDHKNRNKLDNRKQNLRFATPTINSHNKSKSKNSTSQYFGVSFKQRDNIFVARIIKDKKYYHVGSFKDELEAAKAFDNKAKELFGEHARLNFP